MEAIFTYFNGERTESMLFIAVGGLAILVSTYFAVAVRKPFFIGVAITLSLVAVLQLVVGLTIFQRSPQDTLRVVQMVQSAPQRIHAEEVPRMQIVMRNFKLFLGVELSLLIVSIIVVMGTASGTLIRGMAIGLAIQAVFTIVLDLAAMQRGNVYVTRLLTQP